QPTGVTTGPAGGIQRSAGRIAGATVYTLRRSHGSACHYTNALTVPEICRRLGHSQQTHFLHYAHISLHGKQYSDLDAFVSRARARSYVPPLSLRPIWRSYLDPRRPLQPSDSPKAGAKAGVSPLLARVISIRRHSSGG